MDWTPTSSAISMMVYIILKDRAWLNAAANSSISDFNTLYVGFMLITLIIHSVNDVVIPSTKIPADQLRLAGICFTYVQEPPTCT